MTVNLNPRAATPGDSGTGKTKRLTEEEIQVLLNCKECNVRSYLSEGKCSSLYISKASLNIESWARTSAQMQTHLAANQKESDLLKISTTIVELEQKHIDILIKNFDALFDSISNKREYCYNKKAGLF